MGTRCVAALAATDTGGGTSTRGLGEVMNLNIALCLAAIRRMRYEWRRRLLTPERSFPSPTA
jgi:hypothetical protein